MKGLNQIKNTSKQIFNWNVCLLLLAILIFALNQLPYLVDVRPVNEDESWYANAAYNLLNNGELQNTIVGNGGNANFVMPLLMSIFISIFGPTLLAIRMTSVFCGFVTIILLHFIMNELKCSTKIRILGYALFLSIAIFNITYRYGRPECASVMFSVLGIYYYIRYYYVKSWGNMMGICMATYFATCSHPYALLIFAIIGVILLIEAIQLRTREDGVKLLLFLLTGILAILSLALANTLVQDISLQEGTEVLQKRTSMSKLGIGIWLYIKYTFLSKHIFYSIPAVVVLFFGLFCKDNRLVRKLSMIGCMYVIIFPLLFSSDFAMLTNSIKYFGIIAIIVMLAYGDVQDELQNNILRKCYWIGIGGFLILNYAIITTFNYKKYERTNSILQKELSLIVPSKAVVYGVMDMYPFVMQSSYISTHYRLSFPSIEFDYIITNSKQEEKYLDLLPKYKDMLDIAENKYKLIYKKQTDQYGLIRVFQKNDYEHPIQ